MNSKLAVIVMGVSGTGKSTIGAFFAQEMSYKFFDGDDFHSTENVAKMASGTPLNDQDRAGWLNDLGELITKQSTEGVVPVVACSALKKKYRDQFRSLKSIDVHFVYLHGTFSLISQRMKKRSAEGDHFMKEQMLQSQFDALEEPLDEENVFSVSVVHHPEEITQRICHYCKNL